MGVSGSVNVCLIDTAAQECYTYKSAVHTEGKKRGRGMKAKEERRTWPMKRHQTGPFEDGKPSVCVCVEAGKS